MWTLGDGKDVLAACLLTPVAPYVAGVASSEILDCKDPRY
jgi:hypothetical protein